MLRIASFSSSRKRRSALALIMMICIRFEGFNLNQSDGSSCYVCVNEWIIQHLHVPKSWVVVLWLFVWIWKQVRCPPSQCVWSGLFLPLVFAVLIRYPTNTCFVARYVRIFSNRPFLVIQTLWKKGWKKADQGTKIPRKSITYHPAHHVHVSTKTILNTI